MSNILFYKHVHIFLYENLLELGKKRRIFSLSNSKGKEKKKKLVYFWNFLWKVVVIVIIALPMAFGYMAPPLSIKMGLHARSVVQFL